MGCWLDGQIESGHQVSKGWYVALLRSSRMGMFGFLTLEHWIYFMTWLLVFHLRLRLRLRLWQHQCDPWMDSGYIDGRDELYASKLVLTIFYIHGTFLRFNARARWLLWWYYDGSSPERSLLNPNDISHHPLYKPETTNILHQALWQKARSPHDNNIHFHPKVMQSITHPPTRTMTSNYATPSPQYRPTNWNIP